MVVGDVEAKVDAFIQLELFCCDLTTGIALSKIENLSPKILLLHLLSLTSLLCLYNIG